MRHHIPRVLLASTLLVTFLLTGAAIAQQPASPAQISAWESQKAALQAQQQAAEREFAALASQQQALQAEIARLQHALDTDSFGTNVNPLTAAVTAGGKAVIQGINPNDARSVQDRAVDNAYAAIVQRNATRDLRDQKKAELARVQARQAQLAGEISARTGQIAELDRTIAYYRNPRQADLNNEQARLNDLKNRPIPRDAFDQRQLQQDIDATNRRIDQLQGGFQQGGPRPGDPATAPSQGSYNAPTGGAGVGPQSQVPPGYAPLGYPAAPAGSRMPNHQDLSRTLQPPRDRGGSTSSSTGGSSGGATGSHCHPKPDGSGMHC